MTFLSLFAGIGGFDLGLERAGWRCAGQVEFDPFCTRVLERRWPGIPRWGDVRSCLSLESRENSSGQLWQSRQRGVDLLTGGFPCQDLSVAGKRAGLGGERSGLFWEIIRIQKIFHAPWGLFENVPGLLSSHYGRDMWTVLHGLRECWPAVGWRILDSQHFGVAQRRRRVFFVCGPTEAGVQAVLFESEGGEGHPAEGREAGAGVAASLTSGSHGVGVNEPGRRNEDDVNLVIAACLNPGHEAKHTYAGDGGILNLITVPLVVGPIRSNVYNNSDPTMEAQQLVTHPLKAEGADASEDGTGRGVPIVFAQNQRGELRTSEISMQLTAGGGKPGEGYPAAMTSMGVRRLTPVECERLQGFPDNWTCLCDEESCRCPDSPRYRSLGNAVTVSVAEWLGKRLMREAQMTLEV